MNSPTAEAFIDGASSGNPGPSGIGVVLTSSGREVMKISRRIGRATNNVAEYSALICALEEALRLKLPRIAINTDSELLYRQIKGVYRVKNSGLRPYYVQAVRLMQGFDVVEMRHIRREHNKDADKLAKQGAGEITPQERKVVAFGK